MSETLFDLEPTDTREGDPAVTHVLMPNMAYWCGGSILTKAGTFVVGIGGNWGLVTCPECRAGGKDAIQVEIAAPRESGHALIPLSAQQAEAWERGGCIVTIFTARGIGKRACGEPAVDGRLCAGHAAEKARLA